MHQASTEAPRMTPQESLTHRAALLGAIHRDSGEAPFGDLSDGGSADLMTALGETGPTTEDNIVPRSIACMAYTAALTVTPGSQNLTDRQERDYEYREGQWDW